MKVDAVILAGGDGAVIDPSCRFKGLAPIAGKPMVEWVADALQAAESIGDVAVVVPTAEGLGAWADRVDKLVVSGGSFSENVIAGASAFRAERPVLITTGDLPTLLPAAVDSFVSDGLASGADFAYPLIRRQDVESQYAGSQRTYVRLVTGEVTGGNMMLANPHLLLRNSVIGQRLFDTRKSALRMAGVIGLRFAAKLVVGRLTHGEVEAKMEELLGGKSVAIFTEHASIGADVDKPADVIIAERVLHQRAMSGRDS